MGKEYTTIIIGEKPVGLRFAYESVKTFLTAAEKNMSKYYVEGDNGALTVMGVAKILQAGYLNDCDIKETEPSMTYEDFYNYTEEATETEEGRAEMARVCRIFFDSTYVKKLVGDAPAEDGEKKSEETP